MSVAFCLLIIRFQEKSGSILSTPSQNAAVDSKKISLQPSLLDAKETQFSQPAPPHTSCALGPLASCSPSAWLAPVCHSLSCTGGPTQCALDVASPVLMEGKNYCSLMTLLLLMQLSTPVAAFTTGVQSLLPFHLSLRAQGPFLHNSLLSSWWPDWTDALDYSVPGAGLWVCLCCTWWSLVGSFLQHVEVQVNSRLKFQHTNHFP